MATTRKANDDDDEPRSVTLLAPRALALRPDVAPFALLYATALAAFATRPDLRDASAYACATILAAHVFVVLATYWSVEVRRGAHFCAVRSVQEASAVKVVPSAPGGRRQLCRLLRMRAGAAAPPCDGGGAGSGGGGEGDESAHFYWQRRKYVLVRAQDGASGPPRFERCAYPTERPLGEYLASRGIGSEAAVRALGAQFGPNEIAIPEPSFWELYAQQLLAPFFVFQLFCVALWSLDDYW